MKSLRISCQLFLYHTRLEDTEENREENVGEIVTLEDFDRQATAFDKEKVIEELKEEGCIIDDEAGNRAVEIIEKGGIE